MNAKPAAALVFALITACAAAAPGAGGGVRHVVLISVDGLRPDAIAAAKVVHIEGLMRRGAASLRGRTVGSPETLPSHVSMLTGLSPDGHGVAHNTNQGGSLAHPTVFTRVREAGGTSALLFGKSKIVLLAAGAAQLLQGPGKGESDWDSGKDATLAARFAREFHQQRFMFAMIHLRAPDYIGHKQGWMSEPYLAAVRESDAAIGTILKAVAGSGLGEHTAVILTADHGGEGDRHWSESELSQTIPWICQAPGIAATSIAGAPRTVDVAPTVLKLLGLPPLPGVEGKAVSACLR